MWTPHKSTKTFSCENLYILVSPQNIQENNTNFSLALEKILQRGIYSHLEERNSWICSNPETWIHKATEVMARSKYWTLAMHLKIMIFGACSFLTFLTPADELSKSIIWSSGQISRCSLTSLSLRGFRSNSLK